MIEVNDKVECISMIVVTNEANERIHVPAGCKMTVSAVYPATDSEWDMGERSKVEMFLPYPEKYTSIVPNIMLKKV